jgi:hypothetical protein
MQTLTMGMPHFIFHPQFAILGGPSGPNVFLTQHVVYSLSFSKMEIFDQKQSLQLILIGISKYSNLKLHMNISCIRNKI